MSFVKAVTVLYILVSLWPGIVPGKKVFNNHLLFKGLSNEQKQNLEPVLYVIHHMPPYLIIVRVRAPYLN